MDLDHTRLLLLVLTLWTSFEVHGAAGITTKQQCLDSVRCANDVSCRLVDYYDVSRVCFNGAATVPSCEQHSICLTANIPINLHLSLRFSSTLLSAPCRLWLADDAGRRAYNFTSDSPGATGMYLSVAVSGSNVVVEYRCEGIAGSSSTSAVTALRLQAEYYLESQSAPLCRARPGFVYSCDYGSGCVPVAWRCNGLPECKDGLDEFDCPTLSAPREKPTAASPVSPICIGTGCGSVISPDCVTDPATAGCRSKSADSSLSPSVALCSSRNATFQCVESGSCIPASWRCDQSLDCSDSSDESDCDGTSVRVITAAVIGSLVCAVLVVIAAGCTCKLYTLRMMQEQRRSRRSRRYEMPMSAFHAELLRRRAPPPSYEASMQPLSSPAFATEPPLPTASVAQQQQQPLGDVQHELLAHIEAVAAAVRTQQQAAATASRHQDRQHSHHHRHHHHHRHQHAHRATSRSHPQPVAAAAAYTSNECWLPSTVANSSRDSARVLASLDRQSVDTANRTRCRVPASATVGRAIGCTVEGSPCLEDTVRTAAPAGTDLSPTSSLASLGSEGSRDGEGSSSAYERARAAAVREQLDQFLPTLPSFRCAAVGGSCRSRATVGSSSSAAMPAVATLAATVDNVRITASLTASYGIDGCHGESSSSSCFGIAGGGCVGDDATGDPLPAAFSGKKRPAQRLPAAAVTTMGLDGFGGLAGVRRPWRWQSQQQQRSLHNAAVVLSGSDDDEPLLLASANSSSSSGSSTPSSEQPAGNAVDFASLPAAEAAVQSAQLVANSVAASVTLPTTMGSAVLSLATEGQSPSSLVAADASLPIPISAVYRDRAVAAAAATTTFVAGFGDLQIPAFSGRSGPPPPSETD